VVFGAWTPVPYLDDDMVIGRCLAPQVEIQPTAPHYVTVRPRWGTALTPRISSSPRSRRSAARSSEMLCQFQSLRLVI